MHILLLLLLYNFPCPLPHCYRDCGARFVPVLIFSISTTHGTLELIGAAYVTLSPEYSRPTHRRLRTYVFIGLASSGAIPTVHSLCLHGFEHIRKELGFWWILCSVVLYVAGALI